MEDEKENTTGSGLKMNETYGELQNASYVLPNPEYVRIINGFIIPSMALIILLTNAVAIAVFKRQKTYGASQAGLVGVAVSDTLTMLFPAPFYFYEHGLQYLVSCRYLEVQLWISLYLPTITHTASIWLTTILAAQRYLYVCHPFKARKLCTLRNANVVIIATFLLAILTHVSRFFVYEKVDDHPNGCYTKLKGSLDQKSYLMSYLFIRIILIQFVPCTALIILNTKMLIGLRDVTNKKREMQNKSETSAASVKENTRVTIMIVCMAAITLLVELPVGIIQCLYVAINLSNLRLNESNLFVSEHIINLIIILSYPLNFFLFCSMSTEFKQTLRKMCCSAKPKTDPCAFNVTIHADANSKINNSIHEKEHLLAETNL